MENEQTLPAQEQNHQPGIESEMTPQPEFESVIQTGQRLKGKVAIITGGDSGIGRAVAVAYAKEGAKVVISFLNEFEDAELTKKEVEEYQSECLLIAGDISEEKHCQLIIDKTIEKFGKIDILVNNAAVQYPQESIEDISSSQLEQTFRTNIFSQFYIVKAALAYLKEGSSIINTASVTAYKGNPQLLDYSSTKGAIVAFTRSLSMSLVEKGIRVNGVAPGPIWTPLIPATFDAEKVSKFGSNVPMKRPGQPNEVAYCYVFLASNESSYISGQMMHPNGGEVVNG
ncbi:SDR family oxidoreductase [Pedobacter puniceum]|uniref:SDR family oxidoreductase n=1 Tax=Pedobacter puniceum TaxID=2666136 RepID=A0A7K0FQX5_9SPHI|nr:SDR family oxidoreductase [Pedobacter puniceum]MRX48398.1 SDR family oxidoreductase [Pedobacter puniceum]